MNKFIGIGRLTKDPELRYTKGDIAVASFTIAIDRQKTGDIERKDTDYINVLVWQKQAENVKKYLFKGNLVAVDGRVQTRSYDDKDGKKVYVTEIVANNVQFLETKRDNSTEKAVSTSKEDAPFIDFGDTIELKEEDYPF